LGNDAGLAVVGGPYSMGRFETKMYLFAHIHVEEAIEVAFVFALREL
jgi:hypothetical protein